MGLGVTEAVVSSKTVGDIGQQSELWRYDVEEAIADRSLALGISPDDVVDLALEGSTPRIEQLGHFEEVRPR